MKLVPQKKLNNVLDKALLKHRPFISEIELFKNELVKLLDCIDNTESEEFNKNLVRDFLSTTFYANKHYINTKGRQDLVIHNGKDNKTTVGVIIETKKTNKADWFTADKPNSKAIQQLVLYYLEERIEKKNIDMKHLIATNINEWYIIEAKEFEKYFYDNKNLIREYNEWRDNKKINDKTSFFYNEIAKRYINLITDEIPCTYFNIREHEQALRSQQAESNKDISALFKILSPYNLLKTAFANDSNELNDKFYKELLHIIGLEEAKEGGKNIIRRKIDNRNTASLLEKAIEELKTEGLHKVPELKTFGDTSEEQYFNIALELCITWINRILFLKLLEGQLINYHKGNQQYKFLNNENVPTFSELFTLFHKVLAVDIPGRSKAIQQKYTRVPYLNSSLFEISDLEDVTIKINAIDSSETLELIGGTILKEHKNKNHKLKTIDYLFQFLDAYDFASEETGGTRHDNKTLINASVLGKIFEKINGYKDGSIYTPGFITMYMSRQSIRLAVVQKFNDANGWNCKDFEALKEYIDYHIPEARNKANEIINSLKICDPAVGSGHFLVSALNEIITIKSELNILQDINGARLKAYTIEVINDELSVFDEDNAPFTYNPKNKQSQLIQQTLFTEKQTIIENCLFGVDINPNSVKICRLRLWIELLKNAYYKPDGNLETLPNIDINIKCGNSLLSRFALDADLSFVFKQKGFNYKQYRTVVENYKNTSSKKDRDQYLKFIEEIKEKFKDAFSVNDPLLKDLSSKRGQLYLLDSSNVDLFGKKIRDREALEFEKRRINLTIQEIELKIQEKKNNTLYKNAFEWRFEFPEVLNNNGDFEGFDVVLGNPPWGVNLSDVEKKILSSLYYPVISPKTKDTYLYFFMLSEKILKNEAFLSLLLPNTWTIINNANTFRKYFLEKKIYEILDYGDNVFNAATVESCSFIIQIKNDKQTPVLVTKYNKGIIKKKIINKSIWESDYNLRITFESDEAHSTLINKLACNSTLFGNCCEIIWGIKPYQIGYGTPKQTEKMVNERSYHSLLKNNEQWKPLLVGGNIDKYKVTAKNIQYIKYGVNLMYPSNQEKMEAPKILLRQTSDIIRAALDEEKYYVQNSVFIITSNTINLKYLLAILNSKLINFCYVYKNPQIGKIFPEIKPSVIKELPIKNVHNEISHLLIGIVDQIFLYNKQNQATTALEQQIDTLVYQLYDLTPHEIAIVENSTVSKNNNTPENGNY